MLQCLYKIVIYIIQPKNFSPPNFSLDAFIRVINSTVCIFQILKCISKCDHKKRILMFELVKIQCMYMFACEAHLFKC